MGTEYQDYYNWKMPDGSTVVTRTPEPPQGYVPPSWQVIQGEQGPQGATGATGATGARGLDALPAAYDARYGWANPYASTQAPVQAPAQPQQSALPAAMAPTGGGMNPINLMSQFSGYNSPSSLMSMESNALRPKGPSWKI